MISPHIKTMGIEMEGAWEDCPDVFTCDSSVSEELIDELGREVDPSVGEVVSPILYTVEAGRVFVNNYFPDASDETCGMHVHFGMRYPLDYQRLMDEAFYKHAKRFMRLWGKVTNQEAEYFERLAGENEFCRDSWHPELQLSNSSYGQPRYAAWNFCWDKHGTVEYRALPMLVGARESQAAVGAVIRCVESYLSKPFRGNHSIISETMSLEDYILLGETVPFKQKLEVR